MIEIVEIEAHMIDIEMDRPQNDQKSPIKNNFFERFLKILSKTSEIEKIVIF